jgi:rare lipoprotein A (peptidoglycan hydrolase)
MSLFRILSVTGSVVKKAPVVEIMLFSLLAQSCTTISGLSERTDQLGNEATSAGGGVQKASVEPDGRKPSPKQRIKHALSGTASWYGPGFHGKKTASGEIYDQTKFTAAHKTLPLGAKARVTNLENGNAVEVEINDRGPFVNGRIIDLSRAAAGALGLVKSGTAPVKVELIEDSSVTETVTNN